MAKISSYSTATPPVSGSDMLIGTDVLDNDATKNFTVNQLATFINGASGFVPYTGATADLDLGSFSFYSNDLYVLGAISANGSQGNAGEVLTSQGAGLPAIWQAGGGGSQDIDQTLANGNTAIDKQQKFTNSSGPDLTYITPYYLYVSDNPITTNTAIFSAVNPGTLISRNQNTADEVSISTTKFALISNSNLFKYEINSFNVTITQFSVGASTITLDHQNSVFNNQVITYPSASGTIAMSVNGIPADSAGNIVVPGQLYKVYTALLDYNGGAITAKVLENTLGTTINWTNPFNGVLYGTAASGNPFTTNKTWMIGGSYNNGGQPYFTVCGATAFQNIVTTSLFLYDGTITGTPNFSNLQIEIRVYP
jgi:hypothetical protein